MGNFNYNSWMQNGPSDPDPGEFDSPNGSIDNGGGSAPSSTPVTVPQTGNDYSGWDWEQTLVGVLGLTLPNRSDVTSQRWTAINFNSDGGSGLLRIFAATWRSVSSVGPHQDIFVYLNPNLLQPGGIWDNYYFQPFQALTDTVNGNFTGVQLDPITFQTAAAEVQGAITFFQNTAQTFQGISNALQGDASSFQGQAGGAFAQLISNLYQLANSAHTQMTQPASYADLINESAAMAGYFLVYLYNAMVDWMSDLAYQPLGAIYQALENGGVISVDGDGNYQMTNPNSTSSSFGDLTTADAWLAVETAAKQLWTQAVVTHLDPVAEQWLKNLANNFESTGSSTQPLTPPTLEPISAGNNPGANDGSGDGNLDLGDLNLGGGGDGSGDLSLGGGGDGSGDLSLGGGGDGSGDLSLGGGGDGSGDLSLGGGTDESGSVDSALGDGGLNVPGGTSGPGSVDTELGGSGGGDSVPSSSLSSPQLGALRNALADNGQTRSALQQALSLAPATGPLHNSLAAALADNARARTALQAALAGTEPAATALQSALASNGQAESALQRALSLAPARGPLHNALRTALGDTKKTQSELTKTLASGAIPGTSAIHQALNSDNAVQSALHKALLSSQVPSRGPLHTALTNALAQGGEVKSALDHALTGGATPGIADLHQALRSNTTLQSELRTALGQVPAHGVLHNELAAALAGSKNVSTQIHQAMAQAGVGSEPPPGALSAGLGNPAATLTSPYSTLGKQGLTATLGGAGGGGAAGLSTALGGGAGGIGGGGALSLAGHGGAASAASTAGLGAGSFGASGAGSFGSSSGYGAAGTTSSPGSGSSAVPFFPPMAGSGGMGMGNQQQERERTTWLAEEEDVWGTEPQVGPAVLGRDFLADADEADDYDEFDDAVNDRPARDSSRIKAR
jgi:hypothetical protein